MILAYMLGLLSHRKAESPPPVLVALSLSSESGTHKAVKARLQTRQSKPDSGLICQGQILALSSYV